MLKHHPTGYNSCLKWTSHIVAEASVRMHEIRTQPAQHKAVIGVNAGGMFSLISASALYFPVSRTGSIQVIISVNPGLLQLVCRASQQIVNETGCTHSFSASDSMGIHSLCLQRRVWISFKINIMDKLKKNINEAQNFNRHLIQSKALLLFSNQTSSTISPQRLHVNAQYKCSSCVKSFKISWIEIMNSKPSNNLTGYLILY